MWMWDTAHQLKMWRNRVEHVEFSQLGTTETVAELSRVCRSLLLAGAAELSRGRPYRMLQTDPRELDAGM